MVANSTFYAIQDTYCVDAIKDFWLQKRAEVLACLKDKQHVVVIRKCSFLYKKAVFIIHSV